MYDCDFAAYLSGMPDRSGFFEWFESLCQERNPADKFAFVLVDIDKFRLINHALGFKNGDRVLAEMAERSKHVAGADACLFRMAGDTFLAIKRISSGQELRELAHSLLREIRMPISIGRYKLCISACAGVCQYPKDGDNVNTLLTKLDILLEKAKAAGGDNYRICAKEDTSCFEYDGSRYYEVYKDIGYAIMRNEMQMNYQPIVELKHNRIVGFEALLRWNHRKYGMVSPACFIPMAEKSNDIVPIGDWVLDQSIRQCKAWHNQGYNDVSISVNVSANQLKDSKLCSKVKKRLESWNLNPSFLELELTESALISNMDEAHRMLDILRRMGVEISIDDFGTGYSSLNYVTNLNIDLIKIDKSYVAALPNNRKRKVIISAIIRAAHELDKKVIAEGVETKEQCETLREFGCDCFQGYFYSKPVSSEIATKMLAGRHMPTNNPFPCRSSLL